jgi:hypothetical protein|tara:strand:- start:13955 stop:14173 length:219 start_codon:yes stop_codon:yes gene_type:complete
MKTKKEELKIEQEKFKMKEKFEKFYHKLKMQRLKYERETNDKFHELALQRERIKSAEIRKSQERKFGGYHIN